MRLWDSRIWMSLRKVLTNFLLGLYLIRVEHSKKCSEVCVRMVINWGNETSFSEKLTLSKIPILGVMSFLKIPVYQQGSVLNPKILKICPITNFDMGFQKKKKHEAEIRTSILLNRSVFSDSSTLLLSWAYFSEFRLRSLITRSIRIWRGN